MGHHLFAQIAQSVEQGTENPRVGGSIPPLGTSRKRLILGVFLYSRKILFSKCPRNLQIVIEKSN